MSYTPQAGPRMPQKKDNSKPLIIVLLLALAGALGYIVYDKSKDNETAAQSTTVVTTISNTRDSIQNAFNVIAGKLDTLQIDNSKLSADLVAKNNEVQQQRAAIKQMLSKKNLSAEELSKAKFMISDLNEKIEGFVAEIVKLRAENKQLDSANQQLAADKTNLTADKKQLEENLTSTTKEKQDLANQVDIASTLSVTGIEVVAMQVSKSGKESEVKKAKNVDQFKISCLLSENRVTKSGNKELYVVVQNPQGTVSGSTGKFSLREGGEMDYTSKLDVNYEQGKSQKISFNWVPSKGFVAGIYQITMYNNGFKIGETKKELKKGGWF